MAPDGQDLWSGILGGEDVQYGDESDVDEAGSGEEAEASDLEDKEEEDDDDIEEGDVGADDIPVDLQDDGDEVSSETGKGRFRTGGGRHAAALAKAFLNHLRSRLHFFIRCPSRSPR